jgi:predicted porin
MKKLALATLLSVSAIAASAQVSITGKVGEYIDQQKVGSVTTTDINTQATSNIAVNAVERIAGGTSVRATVETSLSGNTIDGNGTKLGDRQRTVGIATKVGSVDLGRNVHTQFLAISNNDAFGTLYGSVAGDVHNLRGLRLDGAMFTTAKLGPLTVAYDRTQDGSKAEAYSAQGSFRGVNAVVARYTQGTEESTVVGVNTKMGNTGLFLTHSDDTGVAKSKGTLVGVTQTVGAITGKLSYGTTNTDVTAYSVGADYALSKRTDVGVTYRAVDRQGSSHDVTQVGVGLVHRF